PTGGRPTPCRNREPVPNRYIGTLESIAVRGKRTAEELPMVMELISVEAEKEKARKAGLKPGRVKGTDGAIQFTKGRKNRIEIISWDEFSDVLQTRNLHVCESNGFM